MMTYGDFYDIAVYGNENWNKGCFSHKEVAEYAYEYYSDFQWSKENDEVGFVIKELTKLLIDDVREIKDIEDSEQLRYWLHDMADELGLIDMDYCDYLETDEWLKAFDD